MGSRKRKLAREGGSEVGAKLDAPNLPNPSLANIAEATIEDIDEQNSRMTHDYERLKTQLDEKNLELEHLTQRRTTQQALSNPSANNINRMFSMEPSGLYVYKGSRTCCLDANSKLSTSNTVQSDGRCKHDICARAYSTGISWRELDTLQWYDLRVHCEKTPRMKDALVKQRDVELMRIKHYEDEEQAKAARRANKRETSNSSQRLASAPTRSSDEQVGPQDLAATIFRSRMTMMQIHKYNIFVGVRQRSMAELAKCDDVARMAKSHQSTNMAGGDDLEGQLRQAQIRSESLKKHVEWYTKKIEEAARASSTVADWLRADLNSEMYLDSNDSNGKELCALVTGLLTDFGMPVASIRNIEHAQSALGHIMQQPAIMRSASVQKTLDQIRNLIGNSRVGSERSTASSSNAASYSPMPTSSGNFRNRIITHLIKDGGSAVFKTEVYSELIQIEDAALIEIHDGYQSLMASPDRLARFLESVKEKATATSPVPEITEKMLDILVSTWYDMSKGFAILTNLDELSDQLLLAKISGLVFARAEKKVEWLNDAFVATKAMLEAVSLHPLHTRITNALKRVQKSVQERTMAARNVTALPGKPHETALTAASTLGCIPQSQIPRHLACHFGEAAAVDIATGSVKPLSAHEQSIVDIVELYSAETASRYNLYLFHHQYCPGCATLRITQLLAALFVKGPQRISEIVEALAASRLEVPGNDGASKAAGMALVSQAWMNTVSCGVKYVTRMVNALIVEFGVSSTPEKRASLFGEILIVRVMHVVLGTEAALSKSLSSLPTTKATAAERSMFGSIIKEFLDDSRFECPAFNKETSSRSTSSARPEESRRSRPTARNAATPLPLQASRLEVEGVNPELATAITSEVKNSEEVIPITITASIVPGPARRKLLPSGERHQSLYDTLEASAKIAGMGTDLARKMSDFCDLQQKVYKRAGMALPPEAASYLNHIKRFAYMGHKKPAQGCYDCECPPCMARKTKAVDKSSKFIEGFPDTFSNELEATIDGRAIENDELLGYGGATVDRIRSIANGEASLEYICWVAHKVGEEADKAEAAGEDWGLLLERFENYFMYHAEIPLELELALENVKGDILPPPDYREFYPSEQWPLIDEVYAIMERIESRQLKFENGTDKWKLITSMVPKPLNLRTDRLDAVSKVESAETTNEALSSGEKQLCSSGVPQKAEKQTAIELLRSDKKQYQSQALQAQIESARESQESHTMLAPALIEPAIQKRFNAYNAAAWPIMRYMSTLTEDNFKPKEDFRLAVAVKVQMQHLDCVRMLQLVAEFRGWHATSTQMKEHLDYWGFQEDSEGHYPNFWCGDTLPSENGNEEAGHDAE